MPVAEADQHATLRFDALELGPCSFAHIFGQGLDATRAKCRVGDMVEMAFAQHDDLRVASNAARKACRQPMWDRVRQHRDRVRTAGRGGEAGHGASQYIEIGRASWRERVEG